MDKHLNEEEYENFVDDLTPVICNFIDNIIILADKYNVDYDNAMKYSAVIFKTMTEISTFKGCKPPKKQNKCKAPEGVTIKPDGEHELSPHKFVEKDIIKNATVQILECTECGEISIGWYRNERSESGK